MTEDTCKMIQIPIPINKILPDISCFTPEENYEMLKIGLECLLRGKKYVSSMSQKDLYEKTKKELRDEFKNENLGYIEKIQKMETEYIVQKEVMRELKEMEQQRLENEMEKMKKSIYELNVQLQLKDKEIEPEVNKRIMIEREKMNTSLQHKEELIKTMKETIDNLNTKKSIVGLDKICKIGENTCAELFEFTFKDFSGFQLIDKSKETAKGDFHLKFEDFDILADAKNYTSKLPTLEIVKIKRDLKLNEHINFGWLISMNTDITGFDRSPIQFEWIQGNQCVCYINNLLGNEKPDEVLRNAWFMCKTLSKCIVEENMDVSEIKILNDKILTLREKVIPIKKRVKELKGYIGNMTKVCEDIEGDIRDILNEETTTILDENYQQLVLWYNNNIVYVEESENAVVKSTDIWYKYRADNVGNMKDLTVTHFRDFLRSYLPEKLIVKKLKTDNCAFEIKNIKLKESIKSEIKETPKKEVKETPKKEVKVKTKKEVKVKTEVLQKPKKNLTENEENMITKLYNDDMLDIMNISKQINIEVGEIVSYLVSNKNVKQRKDTRGYEEYRNSDLYKERVLFFQKNKTSDNDSV